MNYLTKSVELDIKKQSDAGHFTGYGSVFNVVDKGGDIVMPGAFADSLKAWKKSGRQVPVLWQHQPDQPIGHWPDLKEDEHGLLGDAELWLEEAPYARLAQKGMKTGAITGLSIGYRVKEYSIDADTGVYSLQKLDLVEISVVTNPMNDDARVADVKGVSDADVAKAVRWLKKAIKLHQGHMDGSVATTDQSQKEMMDQMEKALSYLDESGGSTMAPMKGFDLPSIREFEKFLREAAGFSKFQAAAIAGGGLVKLLRGEPGDKKGELLDLLNNFNLTP